MKEPRKRSTVLKIVLLRRTRTDKEEVISINNCLIVEHYYYYRVLGVGWEDPIVASVFISEDVWGAGTSSVTTY